MRGGVMVDIAVRDTIHCVNHDCVGRLLRREYGKLTDGWMEGWKDMIWKDVWMDGWMDGWVWYVRMCE